MTARIFGYKNHIGVDRRHKFVRRYVVSDASVHDSQKFEDVLDTSNTASDVWADSAYHSQEIEEKLGRRGLKSRIHRRAYRNRKLSEAQSAAKTTRSNVRARGQLPRSTRRGLSKRRWADSRNPILRPSSGRWGAISDYDRASVPHADFRG